MLNKYNHDIKKIVFKLFICIFEDWYYEKENGVWKLEMECKKGQGRGRLGMLRSAMTWQSPSS